MLLKPHLPDEYINYLLAAQHRIVFNSVDEHQLTKYMLGVEGENRFFGMPSDHNVKLRDLTLELNGRAQYDIIVICNQKVFHFDIKNFSGTYKLQNEHFISKRGNVHTDLLSQLTRAETILQNFSHHHQFHYKVIGRIVFINTNFRLKQYNGSDKILFTISLIPSSNISITSPLVKQM